VNKENIDLAGALEIVKNSISDPAAGLPKAVFRFISEITPLVNVDLLILDSVEGVLLTWRPTGNYPAGWHLPGGIIRVKESFESRVEQVARNELGVGVSECIGPIDINQMIHPEAKARVHFVSLLYRVKISGALDEKNRSRDVKPLDGQWAWHKKWPHDLYGPQSIYRRHPLS
jgi:colanic acid biosynthesis protein WcaH